MSFTEKIDVLDLIINILQEHEQKLDKLVTRLEAVVSEPKKNPKRYPPTTNFRPDIREKDPGGVETGP